VPPSPEFIGIRPVQVTAADLVPFIDWTPFFWTWELEGRYPSILEKDGEPGKRARELFDDAQAMLKKIVDEKWFEPRGVHAFFPAARVGDSVEVYTDESRTEKRNTLHFLRQQMIKKDDTPNRSLADFIAPKTSASADYIGAFAVTAGPQVVEIANRYKADLDDYNAILVQALGDRLAEAFAEYLHKQTRDAWGFGKTENLSPDEMVNEKYQGIRPAAGYPACPDHTEKTTLFQLMDATENTGIELTEGMAMNPPCSVSGLYFSHPESRYFPLGRIDREQVEDYAQRKGWTVEKTEKWLSPNLGYNV
jgi:5-methyltetrahydrofolate--homocysteine methyltransferase